MDSVLDLLKELLLALLWWILLFPVIILASTPVILLISLFGAPRLYLARAGESYARVIHVWSEWGLFIVS